MISDNGLLDISWLDYVVFVFSLLISLGTGIYHAIRSHLRAKEKTKLSHKDEYMMGGRKMPPIPVALSLLTTFLSGILMLGVPAEMFQRGAQIWLNFIIGGVSSLLTATIFLPVFYKMRSTCLHDYFIYRYNSQLIRRTFSVLFLLLTITYMSVVIYSPAVALSPVIGINKTFLILIFGIVTTMYTTIGGLKAVVWTDSIQAVMMYGGVFALLYKGLTHPHVGGFRRVWNLAYGTGRINELWRMDLSPAQFNSMWINIFSGTITWLAAFGVNQLAIQRYCSLASLRDAKQIIYFTILPFISLCTIVSFVGFIALAYYFNCNPLESGQIQDGDHLTITFAKQMLSTTPGLFGLYVSCIMSATLSTLSSGMNSMAAAAYEDFLKNGLEGSISDTTATTINKICVLSFGLLSTALAFAAEPLGGILRVCVSVMGAISGPFVGIFVLAMFWPKAGVKATFISFTAANIIMAYICYLNYIEDPYNTYYLPTNSSLSTYAYSGIGMLLMLVIAVPFVYLCNEANPKHISHLTYYGRKLVFDLFSVTLLGIVFSFLPFANQNLEPLRTPYQNSRISVYHLPWPEKKTKAKKRILKEVEEQGLLTPKSAAV